MICHHVKILPSYYVPHTTQFILMTDLFCSWEFVPLNFSHLFLSFLDLLPLRCHLFSVSLSLFLLCLFIWVVFRSHVWVKACSICFARSDFFHLALYPMGPSMLLQMARWNRSMLCGSLEGRGVWERMHIHINIQYISPETIIALLIGYTPIKNKFFKKVSFLFMAEQTIV